MIAVIGYAHEQLRQRAEAIAARYQLAVNNETLPRLVLTEERLLLYTAAFKPIAIDFLSHQLIKRHRAMKLQGLVRACQPRPGLKIVDLTAGFGTDAAILASFGADVLMLERNAMLAALLEDALTHKTAYFAKEGSLSLKYQDSIHYLSGLARSDYPDLFYIDPMHPLRQKSALVNKHMQTLQCLIGPDDDAKTLLNLAIGRVRKQVVLKWPQRLPALLPPTWSIAGKTVRFDVYTHAT